jgi:hypothetical protein
LEWASPDPWSKSTFTGYERATAAFLDRTDQGREFSEGLRFVDAATPSTSNLVVSVHPIDDFTWSATALASNGRCHALLIAHDRTNLEYRSTHYAKLPKGTACSVRLATPETVRRKNPPD